jgi:acyl transferase domain-containing protein
MGVELLKRNTVFQNCIRYLDSCLQALDWELSPPWNIEAILQAPAEESDIIVAEKPQPVCTAVQIALMDVLHHWGINPDTVVGHSSGEMAAACAAGLLTAREAILAAFCRGKPLSNGVLIIFPIFSQLFPQSLVI